MLKTARRLVLVIMAASMILTGIAGISSAADPPRWMAALYIQAQNAVGLRWAPVAGATGYKVLRSTTPGKDYKEIASPPQAQYFDKDVTPGTTYYYVLQAIAGEAASPNSEEKSVEIPALKEAKPNPPQLKKAVVDQNAKGISLEWTAIDGAVAYNVYRRESFKPAGKEDLIASVEASNNPVHLDKRNLKNGIEYIYSISVLDSNFAESDKSTTQKVKYALKVAKKVVKKEEKVAENWTVEFLGKFTYVPQEGDNYRGTIKPVYTTAYDGEVYVYFNIGRVQVFDGSNFRFLRQFGKKGDEKGNFSSSMGQMAFDENGDLLMADTNRKLVVKMTDTGEFISSFSFENGKDPNNAKDKGLIVASRLAIGPEGNYYVSDTGNHVIRVFDTQGKLVDRIGEYGFKANQFAVPANVVFDEDGRMAVMEGLNSRIQVFDSDRKSIAMFGEPGSRVGQFARPSSMEIDPEKDRLYIADYLSRVIHVYDMEGKFVGVVKYYEEEKQLNFNAPSGISRSEDGVFFVVDYGAGEVIAFRDNN